jgi:hypothetical protein
MTRAVIDANVPIVANGRDGNYDLACQAACVEAIMQVMKRGTTFIDDGGAILAEYTRYLYFRGQPGVGDAFFRFIMQNQGNRRRVRQINLPTQGATNDYVDFPSDPRLANFDRSDRVYAACARKAQVPVLNAVDSDWLDHRTALLENGITIVFLCGTDAGKWVVQPAAPARVEQPSRRRSRR